MFLAHPVGLLTQLLDEGSDVQDYANLLQASFFCQFAMSR